MGRSLHDKQRAYSLREHYTCPVFAAVRATEAAFNYQAAADLSFHRMVYGKSIKALEKMDKELSENRAPFAECAYQELQKRLRKLIEDKKAIEKELRLVGRIPCF